MKNILILLFFCKVGLSTGQQYIDLAKSSLSLTPQNQFDNSNSSSYLSEFNNDITLPIVLNESKVLLTGISHENITLKLKPNSNYTSVTGLTLKVGANIKHNEKWSGTYMLLPKFSSDFRGTNLNDFQIGTVALMKYTKSDNFNYKFGVYANNELFGPFLVPIFGFYYLNPSKKFEAKILLPLTADLNYSFSTETRVGINYKGQARSYNINESLENESSRYLVKATNDIYAYLQHDFFNGINFWFGVGQSLGRSYRVYNEKLNLSLPLVNFGTKRTQLNSDFSNGLLFKAGLFLRIKT